MTPDPLSGFVLVERSVCERCECYSTEGLSGGLATGRWWCGRLKRWFGSWGPSLRDVVPDECVLFTEQVVCQRMPNAERRFQTEYMCEPSIVTKPAHRPPFSMGGHSTAPQGALGVYKKNPQACPTCGRLDCKPYGQDDRKRS